MNKVYMYIKSIFINVASYRCGNCFYDFGNNLNIKDGTKIKCIECGYINIKQIDYINKKNILKQDELLINRLTQEINEIERHITSCYMEKNEKVM